MRSLAPLLSVAVLLVASSMQGASRAPQGDPLDEAVSMSLKGARAASVFQTMSRITGKTLALDPSLDDALVTVELDGVKARTAMTVVCELIGCTWELTADTLRVTPAPPVKKHREPEPPSEPTLSEATVTVDLEGAALKDVLETCARVLGLPLRLQGEIDSGATASVHLADVPARKALEEICKGRCRWMAHFGPPGESFLEVTMLKTALP
jgi:hypothetical protein